MHAQAQGGDNEGEGDARLQKTLKPRHMTMISLGGVIGAGLFVGSGAVIKQTGPATVLSYMLAGLLIVLVMRMLGEMAVANPTVGSFVEYCRRALGAWAGFSVGWLYWYFWAIVLAIEATAGAQIIQDRWLPGVPVWLMCLVLMSALTATNLASVKSFGESSSGSPRSRWPPSSPSSRSPPATCWASAAATRPG
jgi:GABA permease